MTRFATDQSQNDRLKDRQKRDKATYELVLRTLMSTPDGRRYIWLELSECHIFSQTFNPGPGGYALSAFAEGERKRGLKLLMAVTRLCPKEYMTMTMENSKVELEDQDNGRPDPSE